LGEHPTAWRRATDPARPATFSTCSSTCGRAAAGRCAPPSAFPRGDNVLLKWLGEYGEQDPLQSAMAVSMPFRLGDAGERLEYGRSRLDREHLMRKLSQSYRRKLEHLPSPPGRRCRTTAQLLAVRRPGLRSPAWFCRRRRAVRGRDPGTMRPRRPAWFRQRRPTLAAQIPVGTAIARTPS
jgi:hypothetical protein